MAKLAIVMALILFAYIFAIIGSVLPEAAMFFRVLIVVAFLDIVFAIRQT